MPERKQKKSASLRTPQPKKLGISVPPLLRLPHEELIRPQQPPTERPEARKAGRFASSLEAQEKALEKDPVKPVHPVALRRCAGTVPSARCTGSTPQNIARRVGAIPKLRTSTREIQFPPKSDARPVNLATGQSRPSHRIPQKLRQRHDQRQAIPDASQPVPRLDAAPESHGRHRCSVDIRPYKSCPVRFSLCSKQTFIAA
jgi:hypothetical protein